MKKTIKTTIITLVVALITVMATVIVLTTWELIYKAPYKEDSIRIKVTRTEDGHAYTLKTTESGLKAESWVYGYNWLYSTGEADWLTDRQGNHYHMEIVE